MDYSILIGPIVGAIVGYCTNFIAVKMLFKPLKEIRIFGVRLPFTPGVIPKEKDRIIAKVAKTVGEELLSAEYIANEVLNDDLRQKFVKSAIDYKNKLTTSDNTIVEIIEQYMEHDQFVSISEKGKNIVCQHIYNTIVEKDPGAVIVEKVVEAVNDKLKGGFLAVMIGDSFINGMAENIKDRIDEYIDNNLYDIIYEKINGEIDNILNKKTSDISIIQSLEDNMLEKFILNVFDKVIVPEVSKMITAVDIPTIVTNKLRKMDIKELEDILLSVLKKELGYIINFGLIIGFIIGLIGVLPILK